MANALQTQGTIVKVSTGTTGTAVNITGISKASQAVVSAASHSFVVGDIVEITGVVGMTGANGKWYVVATAAGTFTITYDSTNADTWVSGGTAKKMTTVTGCGIKSGSGFDGSAAEIDTTTLCSKAKEYGLGLRDYGSVTFEANWLVDSMDAFQAELRKGYADGLERAFLIVLPNNVGKMFFRGFVKSAPVSFGVDAVWSGSYEVRITGDLVVSEL